MFRGVFKIINKIKYKNCSFEKRADILRSMGVKIGFNCEIFSDVSFGSEPYLIEIGNKVRITSGVKLTTHDGGLWVLRNNGLLPNADKFGKIVIGNNVHIGINSIILPGVTIGNNVIIGAGAVVSKNIPSNSVAVGVPARVIESIDNYYKKNEDKVIFTKNMDNVDKKNYLLDNLK